MPTESARQAVSSLRDPQQFQWHVIPLLLLVLHVHASEIERRNWNVVLAGLALWGMDWFNEECTTCRRCARRRGRSSRSTPSTPRVSWSSAPSSDGSEPVRRPDPRRLPVPEEGSERGRIER